MQTALTSSLHIMDDVGNDLRYANKKKTHIAITFKWRRTNDLHPDVVLFTTIYIFGNILKYIHEYFPIIGTTIGKTSKFTAYNKIINTPEIHLFMNYFWITGVLIYFVTSYQTNMANLWRSVTIRSVTLFVLLYVMISRYLLTIGKLRMAVNELKSYIEKKHSIFYFIFNVANWFWCLMCKIIKYISLILLLM